MIELTTTTNVLIKLVSECFYHKFLVLYFCKASIFYAVHFSFIPADTNVSEGIMHRSSSELIPSFWPIFADFQNPVFSSNLDIVWIKI